LRLPRGGDRSARSFAAAFVVQQQPGGPIRTAIGDGAPKIAEFLVQGTEKFELRRSRSPNLLQRRLIEKEGPEIVIPSGQGGDRTTIANNGADARRHWLGGPAGGLSRRKIVINDAGRS